VFEDCEKQIRAAVVSIMRSFERHHWEDAIQIAYNEAARSFPTFDGASGHCTWMVVIGRRHAIKEAERIRRRGYQVVADDLSVPADEINTTSAYVEASHRLADIVRRIRSELGEREHEVLLRRFVQEQPVAQIADEMGYSVSWVEKQINALKAFLSHVGRSQQ